MRTRRLRRRKLTPAQDKRRIEAAKLRIRANILQVGVARQLEHCYDLEDMNHLIDSTFPELPSAFILADNAEKNIEKPPRRKGRK